MRNKNRTTPKYASLRRLLQHRETLNQYLERNRHQTIESKKIENLVFYWKDGHFSSSLIVIA